MDKLKKQQRLLENTPEVKETIEQLSKHFPFLAQKPKSSEIQLVLPNRPKEPGPNRELYDLCDKYDIGAFKGSKPFLRTPFVIRQNKTGELSIVPRKELNKKQFAEAERFYKELVREARALKKAGKEPFFKELRFWLSGKKTNRQIVKKEFDELVPRGFLESERREPGEKKAAKSKAYREIGKKLKLAPRYVKNLIKSPRS